MIRAILATDDGDGLGRNGRLAWHCEADLKHYRDTVAGKITVCGGKTWNSLPFRQRTERTVVLTSNSLLPCWHNAHSFDEVMRIIGSFHEDVYIIGGASIYAQFMPWVQEIIWTRIPGIADCDRRYRPNTAAFEKVSERELDGVVFMKDAGATPDSFKPRKVEGKARVEVWRNTKR